jgi:uncharacterized protein DUF4190
MKPPPASTGNMPANGPHWPDTPAARRTNPWAISALVCGVLALGFGPLTGIPAVIAGHKALREIRRTGDRGYGLANAGLILGYVFVALTALGVLLAALTMAERAV